MDGWLAGVVDWAVALAGSPWVFPALWAFAALDGVFPPIPSESVVIALASLSISTGQPNFWILGAAAAAGAWTGDQVAYTIGKHIPARSLRFMQGPRAQKSIDWAEKALSERGAAFIIAARYVPIGRVAVNMTAGAVGFPRRRFMGLAAIAAVSWSIYSVSLGIGAGVWLGHNPLLAIGVGVVGGLLIGIVVDAVMKRIARGRRGRRGATVTGAQDASELDGPPAGQEQLSTVPADTRTAGASESEPAA